MLSFGNSKSRFYCTTLIIFFNNQNGKEAKSIWYCNIEGWNENMMTTQIYPEGRIYLKGWICPFKCLCGIAASANLENDLNELTLMIS